MDFLQIVKEFLKEERLEWLSWYGDMDTKKIAKERFIEELQVYLDHTAKKKWWQFWKKELTNSEIMEGYLQSSYITLKNWFQKEKKEVLWEWECEYIMVDFKRFLHKRSRIH